MKKAATQLCIILKAILFIGFSIQIIFGLLWMCLNFIEIQEFAPVNTGIYPLLAHGLAQLPQVIYLLQLAAAFGASWHTLTTFRPANPLWRTWGTLTLWTFPMAMQCHLALLPNSFVSSLTLLEFSLCGQTLKNCQDPSLGTLAKAACCWLGLALLQPEYAWLGVLPIAVTVLVLLKTLRKQLRQLAYCCLLLAAFGGMVGGLNSLIPTEENGYQRTFWFSMVSRTAWPTLWVDSDQWSEELLSVAGDVIWETSFNPDNMERILQPTIEDVVGKERAQSYYRELSEMAWRLHKTVILKQIVWDMIIYMAPEGLLQWQLTGHGYDSASGRNYEIMLMRHPSLTKYYVTYSCWWFGIFMGTAALLVLLRLVAGEKLCNRRTVFFGGMAVVWMLVTAMYYTLRGAGIADYKFTVTATELWICFALFSMRERAVE